MTERISRFAHLFPPPSEEVMKVLQEEEEREREAAFRLHTGEDIEPQPVSQEQADHIDHVCSLKMSDLAGR